MGKPISIYDRITVGAYAACVGPCCCCVKVKARAVVNPFPDASPYDSNNDEGEDVMALERPKGPVGMGGAKLPPWEGDGFMDDHPNLTSFLLDTKWADGTSRQPGTVSFFTQDGALKAAVNDKDRGVTAFLSAQGFYELLFLIDQGIKTDALEWRPSTRHTSGQKPPF